MAFTVKLTDTLKEACEIARADDASLYAFILKNEGRDARSFAADTTEEMMFCILATIVTGIKEATGLSRKEIYKILEKSLRLSGPITREDVGDEE